MKQGIELEEEIKIWEETSAKDSSEFFEKHEL